MQGKIVKTKGTCPRCHGTGRARQFNRKQKYSEAVRKRAVALYDRGLTLRAIAKRLKVNHPQTIKNLLSNK